MIYSKKIMEKENRLHNFTVCFYEDRVIIGERSVKLGKITTDILALSDEVSDSLRLSLENLKKAFKDKLYPMFNPIILNNSNGDFDTFLPYLKRALKKITALPLYDMLNIDVKKYIKDFKNIYSSLSPQDGIVALSQRIDELSFIYDEMMYYKAFLTILTDEYLENVPKRSAQEYSVALYHFLSNTDMLNDIEKELNHPHIKFFIDHTSEAEYVTRPDPDDTQKYIIAEYRVFKSLAGFMISDLFKALSAGYSPRKCQWCGKYFLLTTGHNTVYCDNLAPDDPKGRTCKQVGAHGNERLQKNKSDYQIEARKTYQRITKQRDSGNISLQGYTDALSQMYAIKDSADRKQISPDEAYELLHDMCRIKKAPKKKRQ